MAYSLAALREVSAYRPHIIYCGHLFMAPLGAMLARCCGARLCLHLHGLELYQRLPAGCQTALENAHLILCVSSDTRNRLMEIATVLPERAPVIFNTLSPAFHPGDRAAARAKFGLGDEVALLTVARLDARQRHKGHDAVIAELPELRARGHDVVYLISGDGDDRQRLEKLARARGVADCVRFFGRVPFEQLPDLYRAADLYVMPSTGEGFGIAFIEAMASGTPALGLAVRGAGDALCHGELGSAVAPDDFPVALHAWFDGNVQPRADLAEAVAAKFGHRAFNERVSRAFAPLL